MMIIKYSIRIANIDHRNHFEKTMHRILSDFASQNITFIETPLSNANLIVIGQDNFGAEVLIHALSQHPDKYVVSYGSNVLGHAGHIIEHPISSRCLENTIYNYLQHIFNRTSHHHFFTTSPVRQWQNNKSAHRNNLQSCLLQKLSNAPHATFIIHHDQFSALFAGYERKVYIKSHLTAQSLYEWTSLLLNAQHLIYEKLEKDACQKIVSEFQNTHILDMNDFKWMLALYTKPDMSKTLPENSSFKIKCWPNLTRVDYFPQHLQWISQMSDKPQQWTQLVDKNASTADIELLYRFINAGMLCGYIAQHTHEDYTRSTKCKSDLPITSIKRKHLKLFFERIGAAIILIATPLAYYVLS